MRPGFGRGAARAEEGERGRPDGGGGGGGGIDWRGKTGQATPVGLESPRPRFDLCRPAVCRTQGSADLIPSCQQITSHATINYGWSIEYT